MRRMRRNSHISLQGECGLCVLAAPKINSSCVLKCVAYRWIFIHPQSRVASRQGPKLLLTLSCSVPLPSIQLQGHPEEERREGICLLSDEEERIDTRDQSFSFRYFPFMSTCPAMEREERVAKHRYKLQFDQFTSNQRTHTRPHMLRPPCYLRQFNHWSQALSGLKALRKLWDSFHFISALEGKLCSSA